MNIWKAYKRWSAIRWVEAIEKRNLEQMERWSACNRIWQEEYEKLRTAATVKAKRDFARRLQVATKMRDEAGRLPGVVATFMGLS